MGANVIVTGRNLSRLEETFSDLQLEKNNKYILIEEINNRSFREKIQRVYDYEYLQNLFKFIGHYWKAVIAIVAILAVQAYCDLSLPAYTSNKAPAA